MDGESEARRFERVSRGHVPGRPAETRARWQSVLEWLRSDRERFDQEGLLAERSLLVAPARFRRPGDASAPGDDT